MNTGIEVSSKQRQFEWATQVAQAGFTFAYARATLWEESNDEPSKKPQGREGPRDIA